MVELAGAEIFSRTIFVHEATTEVIWAYSVAVQAVPLPTAAVLVIFATEAEEAFFDDPAVDFFAAEVVLAEEFDLDSTELTDCALSATEVGYVTFVVGTPTTEVGALAETSIVLEGSSKSQESSVCPQIYRLARGYFHRHPSRLTPEAAVEVAVIVCKVVCATRQLQALESFFGFIEQYVG
jgi:hypothetical protein